MIGAAMGAMGGGLSASSGASASQQTNNDAGFGAFTIGGVNLGKSGKDENLQLAIVGGLVLVGFLLLRRKK